MSVKRFVVALLLIAVAWADPEPQDPITYRQVNRNGQYDIYISNRLGCDMTVTLEFTQERDVRAYPPFPCSKTIPGHQEVHVATVSNAGPDPLFRYSYFWNYGSLEAQHDDSVAYSLPYAQGTRMTINQGFHGKLSHTGDDEYAIDFSFATGTPVLAAREGVVVTTEGRFSQGGATQYFRNRVNSVRVRHSDGTIGEYDHFRLNGVVVQEGQRVKRGDLIGYSGATGFVTGAHLHFTVYSAMDGHRRRSYPIRFWVVGNPTPVELQQGNSYTSPGPPNN